MKKNNIKKEYISKAGWQSSDEMASCDFAKQNHANLSPFTFHLSHSKAFSFAEMLMVLVILGIFAVTIAPVLTKKHPKPSERPPHGQFDCYIEGSTVYQRTIIEDNVYEPVARGPVGSSSCTFEPTKRVAYFMVALVGGGGGGTNSANNCGGKGELLTLFMPGIDSDKVTITPGRGGNKGAVVGENGVNTTYTADGTINAKGGKGGSLSTMLPVGEDSNFDGYRASGGYAFRVVNSGNGGDVNTNGSPGAALIVW